MELSSLELQKLIDHTDSLAAEAEACGNLEASDCLRQRIEVLQAAKAKARNRVE